jgi:uncharacterized protein (DUF1697 family)
MVSYVALLHSIVLGAGKRVVMADLKAMARDIGLEAPRTLVATGNLVFEAGRARLPALETRLETAFAARFGRPVDIILRRAADWRRLAAGNPFPAEADADAQRLIVRVSRQPVDPAVVASLDRYLTSGERIIAIDGDLWIHFTGSPGESKLVGALTPKRLGGAGTLRNWNTVAGLVRMLDAPPEKST